MESTLTEWRVPGAVWDDALDPAATGVPREEGWPEPIRHVRRGYGYQAIYQDIPRRIAIAIASYVLDRAEGLTFGVDPDESARQRKAVKWAAAEIQRLAPVLNRD